MKNKQTVSLLQALGPGILFAGASIGTSHLVQSTRAGAVYGLGLLAVIVFANFIRYPGFWFGSYFAVITGKSIVSGYRRLGRWVIGLLILIEIPILGIIIAATALTTAAMSLSVISIDMDAKIAAILLIILAIIALRFGGFKFLQAITKIFVVILTITTLAATLLVLPSISWDFTPQNLDYFDPVTFGFILALCGFMPASMDVSIINSLWVVEKQSESQGHLPLSAYKLDFNIGYIGTVIMALCFLGMGAGVLNAANVQPADNAVAFARQVIFLYTSKLGAWSGVLVSIAAVGVMFTTLITILDGMPRMLASMVSAFFADPEDISPLKTEATKSLDGTRSLLFATLFLSFIAIFCLFFFLTSFKGFIDFVTISAFVIGPCIAIVNHFVIFNQDFPEDKQPGTFMKLWSLFGIGVMGLLSLLYLYIRFLL